MRLLALLAIVCPLAAQQVEVHINCGGPALGIYSADQYYNGGDVYKSPIPVPLGKSALLATERFGLFSYNIPFRDGPAQITLQFIENSVAITAPSQRIFSVTVQGQVVIPALDLYKEVGPNVGYTKTLTANVTGGVLMLYFAPLLRSAVVSSIDAVALPILPPVATAPPPVIGFRPVRAADGSFVVPAKASTLACYLGGLRQTEGQDYTWAAATGKVTPLAAAALATGQGILTCDYVPR